MERREFNRLSLMGGAGYLMGPKLLGADDPGLRSIPKTDTHMHLFGLDHLEYPWLKNAAEINKTFLPEDFIRATRGSHVTKIVFMESGAAAGSSLKEVNWVMEQTGKDPRIKGIVAKGEIVPGGKIEPSVEELVATGWVKGIRAATNAEILASGDFTEAMNLLADHRLSMDLLVRPELFSGLAGAAKKTPDTVFILDHLGNPDIKGGAFDNWKKGIDELAELPNMNCKISGIITRAGAGWTTPMLQPYVHYVIERFGFDRIVYGGDWPVVLRAGSYRSWSKAFERLTRSFSNEELQKLYHGNANRIYHLDE